MKIIGITGPSASGKNEAVKILRHRRIPVIEVDRLAHTLYLPQTDLWRRLVKAFGAKILGRGNKIDRRGLARIVFEDKKKLTLLNRLVHPSLNKAVRRKVGNLKAGGRKTAVINAALLKEIGLAGLCDEVWLVYAKRGIRLKRLLMGGMSKREALARIRAQMGEKKYLNFADLVIMNNGSRQSLREKILRLV